MVFDNFCLACSDDYMCSSKFCVDRTKFVTTETLVSLSTKSNIAEIDVMGCVGMGLVQGLQRYPLFENWPKVVYVHALTILTIWWR